jgi:Zn finger protein HypA/HybF involved in hydrogenase expression
VSNINVKCECKKCGTVVEIEQKSLARDGFECPKCGHEEYKILL